MLIGTALFLATLALAGAWMGDLNIVWISVVLGTGAYLAERWERQREANFQEYMAGVVVEEEEGE